MVGVSFRVRYLLKKHAKPCAEVERSIPLRVQSGMVRTCATWHGNFECLIKHAAFVRSIWAWTIISVCESFSGRGTVMFVRGREWRGTIYEFQSFGLECIE